jgi:hypothetical protein
VNEIFVLGSAEVLTADLRALGVKVGHRAEVGKIGISTVLRATSEWTPQLSIQVEEVLVRYGLRELREGVWGRPDTDEESLRRWEESARAAEQYMDIHRTMTAHPDWTDQEVADSCGADVDEVAYYRAEWDA